MQLSFFTKLVIIVLFFATFACQTLIQRKIRLFKKILYITLVVFISFLVLTFIVMQTNKVQNTMAQYFANILSEKTGSKVSIGKLGYSFSDRNLTMHDVFISDQHQDTLISIKKLKAKISGINLTSNNFRMKSLRLENPYLKIISYEDSTMNLLTFLDALEGKTQQDSLQNSTSYFMHLPQITLTDGTFSYIDNLSKEQITYGMNYNDMRFYNINAEISNFRNVGDSIKMNIDYLNTAEKSGLRVANAQMQFLYERSVMRFDKVKINTPKSKLNAKKLNFSFDPNTSAWSNFVNAVSIDYQIEESILNFEELAFFNEKMLGYDEIVNISSAHATGVISNMTVDNLVAKVHDITELRGRASMNGLPNLDETFFEANITHFQTNLSDIEKIKVPGYAKEYLKFPKKLNNLGTIEYKGNFTGFLADFIFYGQFKTHFGNINTDISLKPKSRTNQLEMSGKVITNDFQLGRLLQNEKTLGNLSFDIEVINAFADEANNSNARIKGKINKVELYDYPYRNIYVDAMIADKIFDGSLNIDSDEIRFGFTGHIDGKREIPEAKFKMDMYRANLGILKLNKLSQDSLSRITFKMETSLKGKDIDNIDGQIKIYDILYANSRGNLKPDTILLKTSKVKDIRTLQLNSKLVDAKLTGNYRLSQIAQLPNRLLSKYISTSAFNVNDSISKEKGNINVVFKQLNPALRLLNPEYAVANNTTLKGNYIIDTTNNINFNFYSSNMLLWGKEFHKVQLKTEGKDSLKNRLDIEKISMSSNFSLYNLSVTNSIADNSMKTQLLWDNKQKTKYKGDINVQTEFIQYDNGRQSIINKIEPSTFYVNDDDWKINEAKVIIDSTSFLIDQLKIFNHDKEYIQIAGMLSKASEDLIYLGVNRFEINHLLGLVSLDEALNLKGKLTGFAEFKRIQDTYTIQSDLSIPNLRWGKETIGHLKINSDWLQDKQTLETQASLEKDGEIQFLADGQYKMSDSSIDFNIGINKLNIGGLQEQFNEYLTEINGVASGKLTIGGTTKHPLVNGYLGLNIPKFTLADTGVSYNLNDTIQFKNSNILLSKLQVFDPEKNKTIVNGNIYPMKENIPIELNLHTDNFRVLNNSYQNLAYGNASVAADMKIDGNLNEFRIVGDLKTKKNATIIVPFDGASEVADNTFITFINPADSLNYIDSKDIILVPTEKTTPLSYDINFSIDPTSEIQVIMDSGTGSGLNSKGQAKLNISQGNDSKQYIYGEYVVKEGSFFYSLKGILNKKFTLEKGGTIRWDGLPKDAFLNLSAVYKLKTSINPLLSDKTSNNRVRQTTVLTKIHITGQIEDPKLTFSVEFPNLDSNIANTVQSTLQTTDITKQVLSLLVFNKFTTPEYIPETDVATTGSDALGVTTSELLSSQISSILSQLSDDVNVGFIYKPGDKLTNEELGLAISTELLQNRVIISGNFGFSSDINNKNNRLNEFVGDFDLDVKIDKKGKLRLRAFSHARDNLYYYESKRNIKGVGLIYEEEFNSFGELWKYYKDKFRSKKKTK